MVRWVFFFEVGGRTVKNRLQFPSQGEKTPLKCEELKDIKWAWCLCPTLWSAVSGWIGLGDGGTSGLDRGSPTDSWGWGCSGMFPFPGEPSLGKTQSSAFPGTALQPGQSSWGVPSSPAVVFPPSSSLWQLSSTSHTWRSLGSTSW